MTNTVKGIGELKFLSTASARPPTARKPRPPMPVVVDADLSAPQRLPSLPGFWWKPDDWKASGTGRFVAPFDPLTADAAYLVEVVFNTLNGHPKVDCASACVDQYAREFGGRAAKSLRWRYRLPVAEQALVSTYREFLTRHLLGKGQGGEAATVLGMSAFKAARAQQAAAASEAERARIANHIREGAGGQLEIAL